VESTRANSADGLVPGSDALLSVRPEAPLRGSRRFSPSTLTLLTTVLALVLTSVIAALPLPRSAYRLPVLHVVLETSEGFVALLVAYLIYGRYRRTRRLRALLVTYALVTVALANLALQAVPQALVLHPELTPWVPLVVRTLGVALLSAAALTPVSSVVRPRVAGAGLAVVLGAALAVGAAGLAFGSHLPKAVDPPPNPQEHLAPLTGSHPVALALVAVMGLLYAVSSVAFTREAGRSPDELQRWLGAGCALAAVARVNYLIFPTLYSDSVYTGDLLRMGFYLFLLVGAIREVQSYWQSLSRAAVLEDRRRLARDLHDGLTQELTFIWSQSQLLSKRPGDALVVERITGATARAIDEARMAIAALTRPGTGAFSSLLTEGVEILAGRYGASARVEVAPGLTVSPEQGDAVLRIVAEAFRNAVLHGKASSIEVTLTTPPLTLLVRDDGKGFDPEAVSTGGRSGGFGLVSMRERAEGLGGTLTLRSTAGAGATVRASWP
jgi:signal transduction histidine kinase